MNFITLTLLSTSFREKLEFIRDNNKDLVADYLLKADSLIKKAQKTDDPDIIKEISNVITDHCRQLTLSSKDFVVRFLPKGKTPKFSESGNWLPDFRQEGKPTKIVRKLINSKQFSDSDYEQFNYHLQAVLLNAGCDFELVSGKDIIYWYNSEHYYSCNGTLGNSCMQYSRCSNYFELYVKQPECQMLIAIKEDLLKARALVWTVDDKIFMDRIYYDEDCLETAFINYAKEQKWYIRENNSLLENGEDQYFLGPEDNYQKPKVIYFRIKLKQYYSQYPYLDSFRYLSEDETALTTYEPNDTYFTCCMTDGDVDGRYNQSCPNCGRDDVEFVYSDWYDEEGCEYCMIWSETVNSYIYGDLALILRDEYDRMDYVPGDWSDPDYVKIDNKMIHINNPYVTKDEDGEYHYKN